MISSVFNISLKGCRFNPSILVFLLAFFVLKKGNAEDLLIEIEENHFFIDQQNGLIVSHLYNISDYNDISDFENIFISFVEDTLSFNQNPGCLQYEVSYEVQFADSILLLSFTTFPLISINCDSIIGDEPKVPANFTYADADTILSSIVGIELRGNGTQSYPKKTYDLEFWTDEQGSSTVDVSFANLRIDDDWILDAMYNEPLRVRSYCAHHLWLKMYAPGYLDDEPEARSGADVIYAELFLNDEYAGVYSLMEQVDRKLLQLKDYEEEIRGELYKGISWGASTFTELPPFDNGSRIWSGYEFKYPEAEDITDWQNLYDFTDFVINAPEITFETGIWIYFDFENVIDYFIFLNLLRATDNTGKNIYLGKYTIGSPYFYVPWDLDGIFGLFYNGTNDSVHDDILSNGFYDRALQIDPFKKTIGNRWRDLREGLFSNDSLVSVLTDAYVSIVENDVYTREQIIYPEMNFDDENLDYMTGWIQLRLDFMDSYFDSLMIVPDFYSLDKEVIRVFPNPVGETLFLMSENLPANSAYEIIDLNGIIRQSGRVKHNQIEMQNLSPGLYLIRIEEKFTRIIVK